MMEQIPTTTADLFLFLTFVFFVSTMISWLCFSRITVKKLERKFKEEGIERLDWDGPGFRIMNYAITILSKSTRFNDDNYKFVPFSATKKYATQIDWYLALWLWISGAAFVLFGIIFAIISPDL